MSSPRRPTTDLRTPPRSTESCEHLGHEGDTVRCQRRNAVYQTPQTEVAREAGHCIPPVVGRHETRRILPIEAESPLFRSKPEGYVRELRVGDALVHVDDAVPDKPRQDVGDGCSRLGKPIEIGHLAK